MRRDESFFRKLPHQEAGKHFASGMDRLSVSGLSRSVVNGIHIDEIVLDSTPHGVYRPAASSDQTLADHDGVLAR